MQIVGNELERLALDNPNPVEADLLGRSAFNRYYYASFLITRRTLGIMRGSWKGTAHAEIPNLLEVGLKKPAQTQIAKLLRAGLVDKSEQSKMLSELKWIGTELAQLLKQAYDARILADYEPEIKTVREGNVILLRAYKLTTAKAWPNRAEFLCSRLLKLWREIGFVE